MAPTANMAAATLLKFFEVINMSSLIAPKKTAWSNAGSFEKVAAFALMLIFEQPRFKCMLPIAPRIG